MSLLVYASPFDVAGRNTLNHIRSQFPDQDIAYQASLEDLEAHLGQPSHLPGILVLVPKDIGELDGLVAMGHRFRDSKVILILPEDNSDVNSKAHLLRPRFLSYTDGDPNHLLAVICKMADAEAACPRQAVQ